MSTTVNIPDIKFSPPSQKNEGEQTNPLGGEEKLYPKGGIYHVFINLVSLLTTLISCLYIEASNIIIVIFLFVFTLNSSLQIFVLYL